MRRGVIVCGVPILATLLVVASYSFTQEPPKKPDTGSGPPSSVQEVPKSVEDPAFDQLVDWNLLETGYANLDAAGVTDAGMLISRAEEALLRTHKSGLTAEAVLMLATNVAVENQDKETLARLAKIAEVKKLPMLADHIKRTSQLGNKTRGLAQTIPLDAPLEEILGKRNDLINKKHEAVSQGLPKAAQDALGRLASATRGGLRSTHPAHQREGAGQPRHLQPPLLLEPVSG